MCREKFEDCVLLVFYAVVFLSRAVLLCMVFVAFAPWLAFAAFVAFVTFCFLDLVAFVFTPS